MKKFLHRVPAFLFTVTVVAAILYLTLFPDPLPENDIPLFPGIDLVVHFIMFGGFAGTFIFDSMRHRQRSKLPSSTIILAIIMGSATGGLIEIAQGSMGLGRSAEWLDFVADTLGSITGGVVAPSVSRRLLF